MRTGAVVLLGMTLAGVTQVVAAERARVELTDLSLEQLANVEIAVTSVSKREQRLFDAASAVYVVSGEDIRRSGATSIPEALRLVPGLQVARISASQYAISSRGLNQEFSNKLLVLVDGRIVYQPLYAGVFWDEPDVLLEDVDRIEVIRGPGATLWGANAVDGVINVITKPAAATQGMLVTGGGGSLERGFGGLRWGGTTGSTLSYRAYTKYDDRADLVYPDGRSADDSWSMLHGGFRLEWRPAERDAVTVQGDAYRGDEDALYRIPRLAAPYGVRPGSIDRRLGGGDVLGRWTHTFSARSDVSLQAYYDRTHRADELFGSTVDTVDVELEHRLRLLERHDVTWGVGYRHQADDFRNGPYLAVHPDSRDYALYSGFLQDDVSLLPDLLRLTLGSKFEHNDFSGFEVQPTARLLWTPAERHAVWAAVSRAIRSPARLEQDADIITLTKGIPGLPLAALPVIEGSRDITSEELLAYELGYRVRPLDAVSFDVAGFYDDYDDLMTVEMVGRPSLAAKPRPHVVVPMQISNRGSGHAYGVETALTWTPIPRWKLAASHSALWIDFDKAGTFGTRDSAGTAPRNQVGFQSYLTLPWHLELDTMLYYVGGLRALDVPGYVRLDVRAGWRPLPWLELSVAGQNLTEDRHLEMRNRYGTTYDAEVPRSVYGRVTWRY